MSDAYRPMKVMSGSRKAFQTGLRNTFRVPLQRVHRTARRPAFRTALRTAFRSATLALVLGLMVPVVAEAQLTTPHKISATEGDPRGRAENGIRFSGDLEGQFHTLVNAGDVDGNGVNDLAFAAGQTVWTLFIHTDGTVLSYQQIALKRGDGSLEPVGGVTPLGYVDGDDVPDLIGAIALPDASVHKSHTKILYLNRDGTARDTMTVCEYEPHPQGIDWNHCRATEGDRAMDINGDRNPDYTSFGDGITITFLDDDDGVADFQHICNFHDSDDDLTCRLGGFIGEGPREGFGRPGITSLDLDGDGVPELVGSGRYNDDGCETPNCWNGVVWVLFMNRDGTVSEHQKIGRTDGGFQGMLRDSTNFGWDVAALNDLDGDDVPELAVSAPAVRTRMAHGPAAMRERFHGEVWILFMNLNGTVKREHKIASNEGGFDGTLLANDYFGRLLTALGDTDNDPETVETLVVSSDIVAAGTGNDREDSNGALWFLFLREDGTVKRTHQVRSADFLFQPDDFDHFGAALASLGDLDGDGVEDLAVGAPDDDGGGSVRGAVWILFLKPDGTIRRHQRISASSSAFGGTLNDNDRFGAALAQVGERGADGVTLAVGAPGDDGRGAVWILHLDDDGVVRSHEKIDASTLGISVSEGDEFGAAVASLGDLSGDGRPNLAVGAPFDDEQGPDRGAVWLLNLNENGTVTADRVLSDPETPQFGRALADLGPRAGGRGLAVGADGDAGLHILQIEADGSTARSTAIRPDDINVDDLTGALAGLGDIDGDGNWELIVGASKGGQEGMTLLFLTAEDSVKDTQHLTSFDAPTPTGFGRALAGLGDVEDGVIDVAIGAPLTRAGGIDRGAIWLTSLRELLGVTIEESGVDPAVPTPDQDVVVTASIHDRSGDGLQASLFYRRGGDTTFSSKPLVERPPGKFSETIWGHERGVEYYISAANSFHSTSLPEVGTISVPFYVPDGLRHPLHAGTEAAAYRLISVPLDLDEKNVRAVLEDDLGPYDRTKWRFFDDDQITELVGVYQELRPGDAYWLLVKEAGKELTTGAGLSLRTDEPFRIPLHDGWNLVSSPFSFPVPVANVRATSGRAIELLKFEGSWSSLHDALMPFAGYAVFSPGSDELLINPDVSAAGRGESVQGAGREGVFEWFIRILASQGEAGDAHTFAAVSSNASVGLDELDRPEPPGIGEFVRVSFPHAEWKTNAVRYSADVRPVPEDEERWTVAVQTRRSGRVDLQFDGVKTVPSLYGVWLVDEVAGVRQDLRAQPHYAVASGGDGQERRLTLLVTPGRDAGPEIPSSFELFQNFPNPFEHATTLRYGVPEASAVLLEVYDLLGRRVARLVEGNASAGYHAAVWNGRSEAGVPVGSGTYLVRMRSGGTIRTLSIVRVR